MACKLCPALALACLLAGPASSQPVDCTGISDVSSFDGDSVGSMDGVLTTVRIASGLSRPLFVTSPPGDVERLFVAEQDGKIRIIKNGSLLPFPFLDISSLVQSPADGWANEEGLLGLAFDPDYSTNGRFYVYYTGNGGTNYSNWVDRFTVSPGDPDVADPASLTQIIHFKHPTATYHHGGMLAFSPIDGHLYIAVGDGALSPCDPSGNSQNITSKKGKLLRLDVSSAIYSTEGNPFDGPVLGSDEVWAYGVRNAFRFSFDREEGTLYIGDVGQFQWEEINCAPASSTGGENYGWVVKEGSVCPNASCGAQGDCDGNYVDPIHEYSLAGANCTVIGGYVYRGCRMGDLHGTYFFADNCSNIIESFRTDASCSVSEHVSRATDLAPGGGQSISQITSFGEDARGEIYIVDRGGEVFKVLPTLSIMELSGANAVAFQPGDASGTWSWEDLNASSSHPISGYRVYRSSSPTGPFNCRYTGPAPEWPGGDPATPAAENGFYYLVVALNAAGEQTVPGYRSDGTPRAVSPIVTCP